MSEPALPQPLRTAGVVFAVVLGLALAAAIAAAAWIGVRGYLAYGHLSTVEATAQTAAASLSDPAQASELIEQLSDDTSEARSLTSDPVWRLAEGLPWVGPQLAAVSTVSAAADDVVGTALTPLADVASTFSLDAFRPTDGRIDTSIFGAIQEPAQTGADGVAKAAASVDSIDTGRLLAPLREAVDQVSGVLDTSAVATDALARASALMPAMLGAGEPRDYLVVFQNNAEWRSLGGIVGAMAVIHTEGGAMSMTTQGSSSDFRKYAESVLPLEDEVRAIYDQRPGQWIQNVTQIPDFTIGGPLAREMWLRETGLDVDGVISMDPVALSYLLASTGPVTLPTGDTLTADNAVQLLLNDVYLRYERPADQDAFFAAAAASVFESLSSGTADPTELVSALGRAGEQRRLLLWSAHPEDQQRLEGTTLAGALPVTDRETARYGVYLNDGTGSKMDYYVTAEARLEWDACLLDENGRATGTSTLNVTLVNTAPADAATSLPEYITGGGNFGVPPGVARTVVYVYLPEDYQLVDAALSVDQGFGGGFHQGRQVLSFGVDMAPGETVTATLTSQSPDPAAAATVAAEVTPTIDPDAATTVVSVCGQS